MSRIDCSNRRLVIMGVGYREQDNCPVSESIFVAPGVRPNIGAAVALHAARAGYALVIVSRTASKLERVGRSIREHVPVAEILTCPKNLLDPSEMRSLADSLPKDRELDLVHSAGLAAGSYKLLNDNPYLDIDQTPVDLPVIEFEAVVKSLVVVVQAFLPRWRQQTHSHVVVVSSMSGIRAVPFGFSHSSAKGGLHQAVRSLSLELNPLGVRVSEVLPGIVDTGMYEPEPVDAAVRRIGKSFGYEYRAGHLPQMEPGAVAEAVLLCLTSDAHILSISMVSNGQFPNNGS